MSWLVCPVELIARITQGVKEQFYERVVPRCIEVRGYTCDVDPRERAPAVAAVDMACWGKGRAGQLGKHKFFLLWGDRGYKVPWCLLCHSGCETLLKL